MSTAKFKKLNDFKKIAENVLIRDDYKKYKKIKLIINRYNVMDQKLSEI